MIDKRTGAHVPKRQVEELTVRAAQDFDAFYERRLREPEVTRRALRRDDRRLRFAVEQPSGRVA